MSQVPRTRNQDVIRLASAPESQSKFLVLLLRISTKDEIGRLS